MFSVSPGSPSGYFDSILRGALHFYADRLDALADRARAQATGLRRRLDDPSGDPAARKRLGARLATLRRRARRLCVAARTARRDARLEARAAEAAALDRLEMGLLF
jgi:hypothetical protein